MNSAYFRKARLAALSARLYSLYLVAGFCGLASVKGGDVVEAWVQRYDGHSYDYAEAVAVDSQGNVIVTGGSTATSDSSALEFYTAKYAGGNGALLWEQRNHWNAGKGEMANAIAVDSAGNVVVSGESRQTSGKSAFYTAKYAASDGKLLWERRSLGPQENNDRVNAIALDRQGNVFVTGASEIDGNKSDFYTVKYSADGTLLWERRYDGPANLDDGAKAIAVDRNGDVIVTGYSVGLNSSEGYYTAKYSGAKGTVIWEARYDGPGKVGDMALAVALDSKGNAIVTGSAGGLCTIKYAAKDGAELWVHSGNGSYGSAVAVDRNGDVVIAGSAMGKIGTGDDYYTAKYAAADGALLWERTYNGPGNGDDIASAVALDASGNVIVSGYSALEKNKYGANNDIYTAKYAKKDGRLIWEKRYNGPTNGGDAIQTFKQLAVTPDGGAVVAGRSWNKDNEDYVVIKYAESE